MDHRETARMGDTAAYPHGRVFVVDWSSLNDVRPIIGLITNERCSLWPRKTHPHRGQRMAAAGSAEPDGRSEQRAATRLLVARPWLSRALDVAPLEDGDAGDCGKGAR